MAVSLRAAAKRAQKDLRKLRRIYLSLCRDGAKTEQAAYFADSFYPVILASAQKPAGIPRSKKTETSGFSLAKKLIQSCGEVFPSDDEIIMFIRSEASLRRIFGCETEYLPFCLSCVLLSEICRATQSSGEGSRRYISLLRDLHTPDWERINDTLNPVAIRLNDDIGYRESDRKTRLIYRETVYESARLLKTDENKVTEKLLSSGSPADLKTLPAFRSPLPEKYAVLAAALLSISGAALALFLSTIIGCPLLSPLLWLPAVEALRPVSDHILSRFRGHDRLLRLKPDSELLKQEKTVAVLSSAVSGAEDAAKLYDKLLGLYCPNPQENIYFAALLDLPPEQVPYVSEDRAVIESLQEAVSRLEKLAPGKFFCFVRKRSFSKTQQEYMGAYRKRGAIIDLAKFLKTGEGDFYAVIGDPKPLVGARFILAADSDTIPLMDSIVDLASVALHPLNRVKTENGRVISGYGIVAPRVITRLGDSIKSEFSKSLGGVGSRSSYDEEAHSLYQDVFARGTFCGKGLIDVSALLECAEDIGGERILSHDILEGELLHTAYAGDVVFTEGFPKSPESYYLRLMRWIRGDFQNLPDIIDNRYSPLSKLKLLDNLRRAVTPVSVLLCFLAGAFLYPPAGGIFAACSMLLWLCPALFGFISSLFRGGLASRSFYSGIISQSSQSLRYILFSAILLPTLALKSLRAAMTGCIRLITRKNLLEWTTSEAQDRLSSLPFRFFLLPEAVSLALLWPKDHLIRLFAVIFLTMPALLSLGKAERKASPALKYRDMRELSKQTADMWGFFENYVGEKDNFLPPDNVQFSPVYRVAHRTSPTNIGLYLLSVVAACDRKLISRKICLERLERTVSTVERLEKYRGNLYNWYDTETLKIISPAFVSSVDSGNFAVCLVTLKEALREFGDRGEALKLRVEKLIRDTDLSVFYDGVRGLMAIGLDPATQKRTPSHYDILMSEARLCSFWAIASRQVPKEHWKRLSRAMLTSGFFGGAASYSGTMFEYFMPELFLKSPEGSLSYESLRYALGVQKRYAKRLGRPYGVSESGFYSFDPALNYRYEAHGVPATGIKRGLGDSYVVSPYSTYISLGCSPSSGAENLRKLAEMGMRGAYGLYEALDLTSSDSPEPVRSYMAHHVGMSLLGCVNVLNGGIMQKRFMRDLSVRGAYELLEERFRLDEAVYENVIRRPEFRPPEKPKGAVECFDDILPERPRMKLLSGGGMSAALSDSGDIREMYQSLNLWRTTFDPLTRPQGAFCFVSDGEKPVSLRELWDSRETLSCEFSEGAAAYYKNTPYLRTGMKLRLCEDIPCSIRTFAVRNLTRKKRTVSLACLFEPSLQSTADERSHPAYQKMFLRLDSEPDFKAVTITRVGSEQKIYVGIGFLEDISPAVSFDRGEVLPYPSGIKTLSSRILSVTPSLISEPDPCVFIRASVELPASSSFELNLFTVCAQSREELLNLISDIRRRPLKFSSLPRSDTASGRLAEAVLPKICYGTGEKKPSPAPDLPPLTSLWELSASIDLPTVLIVLNGNRDEIKLKTWLGAYRLLRRCGLPFQIIAAFDDGGRYDRTGFTLLSSVASAEGCEGDVYTPGGIIPLDLAAASPRLIDLSRAFCVTVCENSLFEDTPRPSPADFIEILPSKPQKLTPSRPVACGGFSGQNYTVTETPPLPWCHVLSSKVFGTLLSSCSLGFTYAFNSRENRLTPWDNDPSRDNSGERLILFSGGRAYDLINGSAATFGFGFSEYRSEGEGYSAIVRVGVSEKGMCKKISVRLTAPPGAKIAYYAEPCMGVDRSRAGLLSPKRVGGGLLIHSPCSELSGYMFLSSSRPCSATCDRYAFFRGDLKENVFSSFDLSAALVCDAADVDFYLSYALSESAALQMPSLYEEHKNSPPPSLPAGLGESLDPLVPWLWYQALHCRIYARTGFYQCSGAYGFRDQLQDAVCLAKFTPGILKTMILRSCASQFEEGDVLHWRHTLPLKKPRGIRTLISDDPLWLVYAVCVYFDAVGPDILDIPVSYCFGLTLSGERERYGEVCRTALRETVYQHCKRAISHVRDRLGPHGLMLIGSGDWNDGFNRVGIKGRGESVWLSEFYILCLERFSKTARHMNEPDFAQELLQSASAMRSAVEKNGRERDRYLRGYFDSSQKLGSRESECCSLDSLSQSFAEFAGLDAEFTRSALIKAYSELFDRKRGIIKLFTPPFAPTSEPDPGYIRNYPAGLRENGGQYTHAAVWLAMALARAGFKDKARELYAAISPIKHSENGGHRVYKTEPYYLCGDVYAGRNCSGRGGWSIYTGAAGWLLRALDEIGRD